MSDEPKEASRNLKSTSHHEQIPAGTVAGDCIWMNVEQSGFHFEIAEVGEYTMSGGEPAFIFFLNITNLDSKARLITLAMATYVTSGGEQLEQDIWLTGYLIQHGRIKGNAHRKSGLVFYKNHLSRVSPRDCLFIEVVVPDRAKKFSLRFEKSASQGSMPWDFCGAEVEDFDVKPTPRVASKALTKSVERLEVFEERFGVTLEKVSVNVSDDFAWLTVAGEVHLAGSGSLARDIKLVAAAYDSEGSIIGTGETTVYAQRFSGFDVFTMTIHTADIGLLATRIRVFPKAY